MPATAKLPERLSSASTDPRVDAYVAKSTFAPLLTEIRALVHKAVPEVEETMKWSRPFFTVNGTILGNMAAFKAHCSFGIWNAEVAASVRGDSANQAEGMGSFGRITSRADLPSDAHLLRHLRAAAKAIHEGHKPLAKTAAKARATGVKARPSLEPPADLVAALGKRAAAKKAFAALSPSHQREYVEWVVGAKRPETRARRIEKTVSTVAEGKSLNWKYQ